MQSTSFLLMLMIGSCVHSSSSSNSDVLFEHFNYLDKSLVRTRMFDKLTDGVEVAFNSQSAMEQFYIFTTKSDTTFWFSITPCNNPILEWYLKPSDTGDFRKWRGRPAVDYGQRGLSSNLPADGYSRINRSAVSRRVPSSLDSDTGNITTQIEGIINNIPSTNTMMYIRSAPSTMVLVYISTRYSTKESFIGYPRIEKSEKSVSLCVTDENELKVTVIPASSTEMADIDYCVAVNSKRPLYHRCSAQMFIPYSTVKKEERVRDSLRSHYLESVKIRDARYKCTNKTKDITFKNLPLKNSSFYINVYSINRISELSSSFPTVIWRPSYHDLKKCDRKVKIFKTSATGNHKDHSMILRFTTDLYIEITGEPPRFPTYNSHWYLWFQPCSIPPKKTRYRVRVQQVGARGSFQCDRRLTRHPVNVCDHNNRSHYLPAPGSYKVTVTNPGIKELSSIAGYIILSHTGVHNNLFPYRGNHIPYRRRDGNSPPYRRKGGNPPKKKKNGPKIDIQFHCHNDSLSASVFAYKQQWYCFYLKETPDRSVSKKELKRSIAEEINLCGPRTQSMLDAERQCTSYAQWSPASTYFNRVTVTFYTRLQKDTAYTVYVYYGMKVTNNNRIRTKPFYGFKYISVKRHRAKCSRKRSAPNASNYFFRYFS